MLIKIIYILFFIILFLASIFITKFINKKFNVNRWIIGLSAFLVIIVPSLIFKNIDNIVMNIIYIIFIVMCIMFFETTRIKLENNKIKGILNFDDKYKKK
ncbi:hypothetical protein SAMN05428976_105142 [Clostridium sp. USBA 49]|uniref:hypothetical protein n=1 Tax=Clostridium sp. USBA 49 TaxID=1881060 RepID=UPI000999C0ED|nr:hypothetical protein [Clostridium sp. USBA 49]SKA82942.1 hypothetical protein SAMN05428976_105142 [Clostridium sp. USBA 49]